MSTPEIEEFAKMLVQTVRDTTMQSNDNVLAERHVVAERWRRAAASGSAEALSKVIIADVVDSTLFHLLHAIDEGRLKLSFTASNGKTVDLTAEGLGELAGWYASTGGWCEKYTKERFINDFADLKDFFEKPSDSDGK